MKAGYQLGGYCRKKMMVWTRAVAVGMIRNINLEYILEINQPGFTDGFLDLWDVRLRNQSDP